mgnify:CR=1 FL=1
MSDKTIAVQKMQDYIDQHLYEKITLNDLGQVASFSPWYAIRLFRELTGNTPGDYIRRLRLSRSALKLRDEKVKILDLVYELGYGSVDGYQRAFLREFGCNPKEYATNPIPLPLFTVYGVKFKNYREKRKMETTKNIFIQIIEKPERKVLIKRGIKAAEYFDYCEEVGCDVWGILTSIKAMSGEPVCLWLPKKYRLPNTSEYVQGVEVSLNNQTELPAGFDSIILPACKYLMFQGEPFKEEDYQQAIEEVRQAIAKYDPKLIGYKLDPDNPRIQLEPIGERGYIELISIK